LLLTVALLAQSAPSAFNISGITMFSW